MFRVRERACFKAFPEVQIFSQRVFLSSHQVFPLRVCGVHPSKYMCCLADPRSMLLMGCNCIDLVCVLCLFLVFCRRAQ